MKKELKQLFDEFVFECEFARKVRAETLRNYRQVFQNLVSVMPDITVSSLTSQRVTQFFRILQERKRWVGNGIMKVGVKKSTIATYWSKLNVFFTWLQAKKYIAENPFNTLSYPTPEYEDKKFLKKEDIEKILTAIHTHCDNNVLILKRNLVIFYILLFCGLRREELLALQVRDIDFIKKTLTIRGDTSKSGRTRQVPIHSTAIMHLKDYMNARKLYKTPYLIVSSKQDERLTVNGLKHMIAYFREVSGLRFHLHQFRHTFAVNFLKVSNNITKLKQLLGHKSITMTMAYLRCLPIDELRGDVESMSVDDLL